MKKSIFAEAEEIISGDREKVYGRPEFNLETIAKFWRVYVERKFGVDVTFDYADVSYMMVLLKLSRLINSPDHEDSQRDGIGYFGLPNMIQRQRREWQQLPLFPELEPKRDRSNPPEVA